MNLDDLRAVFDATTPFTVGLEEEVLLVEPGTGRPAPVGADLVATAADRHVKVELPACQVELLTDPVGDPAAALAQLGARRAALAALCGDEVRPMVAAVHPLVDGPVAVTPADRARTIVDRYGEVAQRQLVAALQVHVAVGDADTTLAVHNALRGHLPELAALAAAAPFHGGRDTGFASVRPLVAAQLPRQGVPPVLTSWARHLDDLRWGEASGSLSERGQWWWELRPHLLHGTLEVRVPDAQPTLAAAAAVVSVVRALVVHLAERHGAGEELEAPPTWRIAENRWSALRDGTEGCLADLTTGESVPTRRRLHELLDAIEAHAPGGLDGARALIERNTAVTLRGVGVGGAVPWLMESFLAANG